MIRQIRLKIQKIYVLIAFWFLWYWNFLSVVYVSHWPIPWCESLPEILVATDSSGPKYLFDTYLVMSSVFLFSFGVQTFLRRKFLQCLFNILCCYQLNCSLFTILIYKICEVIALYSNDFWKNCITFFQSYLYFW